MTIFNRVLMVALALLPAATAAQSAGFQNIEALEDRLILALDARIGTPGGPVAPIDRRLRLAACPGRVEIDPPALGAVALRCPAIGWRIRVPLVRDVQAAQQIQRVAAVEKAPRIVRRGDPVELVASTRGFSVSAEATAQEDGAQGDRIKVKTDKAQIIYAEVLDAGRVALPGFK